VDFTREPIIETIITPKDGCKLVVRNSKGIGQEEYFVDAVEVISFGHALFFRSLERPKSFLVPVNDYEVLEVREARMVLKSMASDRSIKIGGGKEGTVRASRDEKVESFIQEEEELTPLAEQEEKATEIPASAGSESRSEAKLDKKRDRRRHYRKRRGGKEEGVKEEGESELAIPPLEEERVNILPPEAITEVVTSTSSPLSSALLSSLLQPPPQLISETINRYRENFKSAFFLAEEEQYKPHHKAEELLNEDDEDLIPRLQNPAYEPFSNEEENTEVTSMESFSLEDEPISELLEPSSDEDLEKEREEDADFLETEESQCVLEEVLSEEGEASLPLYAEEEETVASREEPQKEMLEEEKQEKEQDISLENVADFKESGKSDEFDESNSDENKKNHQLDFPF
jgi:hypothetical protein